jgi:hypothetical protein
MKKKSFTKIDKIQVKEKQIYELFDKKPSSYQGSTL